ncbi:MAG: hypothetical protein IPI82_03085 [Candidatus Microthrix sp.]|nr:hypothetical protein [Candidatus Microthrix sp.]MBK7321456.1 hypothetical protein [Candidatus Microthrix sp.]
MSRRGCVGVVAAVAVLALGLVAVVGVASPASAAAGSTGWSQVSAGDLHTCAIAETAGAAYCWGANGDGQLGNNDPGVGSGVPVAVEVPVGVTGWSQITAGGYHTCAVAEVSGAAYCWGYNDKGQLGNNDPGVGSGVPVAVEVAGGVTGWSQITAGGRHTCAVAEVSGGAPLLGVQRAAEWVSVGVGGWRSLLG